MCVCLLYSLSYIMTFVVVHQVDALSWHRMRVCAALHRLRRFVITAIRVEPQSIPLYLPSPCPHTHSLRSVAHVIWAYQHADPSILSCIHYLIAPTTMGGGEGTRLDRLFSDVICMQTYSRFVVRVPIPNSVYFVSIRLDFFLELTLFKVHFFFFFFLLLYAN